MSDVTLLRHAGNFYDQRRTNNRLTGLLIAAFVAYYLVIGYGIDVLLMKSDPLGLLHSSGNNFPYATAVSLLVSVIYAMYCYYRGDEMVIWSIRTRGDSGDGTGSGCAAVA